ncbi:MAG: phosphatidate cytidylyltransferase [Planctomycetes bacterium]|nr:phosphatidate cytidylyltransferase [Planctomycetota bacterium]
MTILLAGLVLFDGWLDGSLTASTADNCPVQATLLMALLAVTLSLGGIELSRLAAGRGLAVLNPVTTIGLVLVGTAWYWPQLLQISQGMYLLSVLAFVLAAMFLQQHLQLGNDGVLANCGVSCFSLLYLGLLGAFVLGIRIDEGPWAILMFIFVVKCSDIGAYTLGKLFGKHKLAPRVSPKKTWEGLAGAIVAAMVVSIAFALVLGIMQVWVAPIFGACMAVIGQLSDLAESMLKRDAQQKDSSNRVPGFGGILDVIDSLLLAAPVAYAFFGRTA